MYAWAAAPPGGEGSKKASRAQSEMSQWLPGNSLPVCAAREKELPGPFLGKGGSGHSAGPRRRRGHASAQNLLRGSLGPSCCVQMAGDGWNCFPRSLATVPLSTGCDFCHVCKAGLCELPSPRFPQASSRWTCHGLPAVRGPWTKSHSLHLSNSQ